MEFDMTTYNHTIHCSRYHPHNNSHQHHQQQQQQHDQDESMTLQDQHLLSTMRGVVDTSIPVPMPSGLERAHSYTKEMKPEQEYQQVKIYRFWRKFLRNLAMSNKSLVVVYTFASLMFVFIIVSMIASLFGNTRRNEEGKLLMQDFDKQLSNDDEIRSTPLGFMTSSSKNSKILYRPLISKQNSYHINMDIGTPTPRRKLLIVDTGSYLTAFPCHACKNCGKRHSDHKYFNFEESKTGEIVPCDECKSASYCVKNSIGKEVCWLSMQYTEGSSWTGFEVSDLVGFGDSVDVDYNIDYKNTENMHTLARHVFGCINSEKGTFQYQSADGIMGMAVKSPGSSIVDSFYNAGMIDNRSFSLCLSKKGGVFSLGGSASASHSNHTMEFTPLNPKDTLYVVEVEAVFIGDQKVSSGLRGFSQGRGSIIDSGTTDTFLPASMASPFQETWKSVTKIDFTNEAQVLTWDEVSTMPKISFELKGGLRWIVHPKNYFESLGNNLWKNRIYLDEPSGAVFGSNTMLDHDVFFDLENNRLGVAEADCNLNVWR